MIILLHCYSRANRGDGLLVDLALKAIRQALGEMPVAIMATDARSFSDQPRVYQMPGPVGNTAQSGLTHGGLWSGHCWFWEEPRNRAL